MKILSVVGARPNFMKVAPILGAIGEHNRKQPALRSGGNEHSPQYIRHVLVHTGQHYGKLMSDSFFHDLNLPKPDVYLGVGSGSHAAQSAEIMLRFEGILLAERPDIVVVVGDVNSTLACALVAAKISFDFPASRPLIAHVEAGLRSFDRTMPEEINRVVTDQLADLLFVTEEGAIGNLLREGISADKIYFVGNTMIDSLLAFQENAESSGQLDKLGLRENANGNERDRKVLRYAVLTLHRPANVDSPKALHEILAGLEELAAQCPIVFPVHPRTRRRMEEFAVTSSPSESFGKAKSFDRPPSGVVLTDPLGYLDFLCLLKHASIVVTDSGGIQEEATCLGIPCVTVRDNTERPVTVEKGTNVIAGTTKEGIKLTIQQQLRSPRKAGSPKHWDGHAAARIVDVLRQEFQLRTHGGMAFALSGRD